MMWHVFANDIKVIFMAMLSYSVYFWLKKKKKKELKQTCILSHFVKIKL